ncbi:uncharacterized protein MELLADRAFT_89151 [Melampsora larici-populina 98AG31]|uniref:Uncharacterized protein n=1 Tax=Melampsora larici-populina (strain 98AG31 / pathotype 3-4-7) TaxID=747676 RepID=F4R548_MELLP|nr:uncharacterized protein MELLADRAFT_89151 [Melampsora larici-populina 98AG31]EGG12331.1 hypothetical protein MELLADRAFT_89151 [Melampsora larici-populina 98AG31]
MPSSNSRVTRSTQANTTKRQTSSTRALPAAKRPRRQLVVPPVANALDAQPNHLPTPSATQHNAINEVDLSEIMLQNYHQYKKYWPLARIQDQLARQRSSNHQLSAEVIVEGQAVLEALDHTLHMIAMISGVGIIKLNGLLGGTHGENPWHRWLSFAIAANKNPMPQRGDPNAAAVLAFRNKSNSDSYQALDDDKYAVFTSCVFYALGGYPDYSSITINEDINVFGDSSILVPEVPKLSPEDENLYRPIYERLVDEKKVKKDRELNTPGTSVQNEEKRSLQCMKKIAQQVCLFGIILVFICLHATTN